MNKNVSGTSAVQDPRQSSSSSGELVSANFYELTGHHLHITYARNGFDGKPHFTYQDAHQTLTFTGDQIETTEGKKGQVVSVTTRPSIDSGSTTFSLLVPRVNIPPLSHVPIQSQGITTIHKFSLIPTLNRGQRDIFTVTPLHGTAAQVIS
jgi:hypothetical protein